ncbi:ADP-ribosylglycohydrolase family protein [Salegentibacter maritimus]|uniref:ADP-ribosylglycohydrolase family protein n=1 Tax=Salegentibacter maritimus TaxID=2794347 RepID=UPI0018E4103E|nr:ADP-ribosylglycohydrolase family protein [Salegentibacter maritimus]MBI6115979.1 ADP-ribosylglycohydrolase family protein [Salegentibacter maritimus]
MIGSIIGDIVGSVFEHRNIKITDFKLFNFGARFTDDTVLTVAIADAILNEIPYEIALRRWGQNYPGKGYGNKFDNWLYAEDPQPYNSWGNGSAMRVSPVGFAFNSLEKVLEEAKKTAEVTHDHPEGIKGAQAVAAAIFLARTGSSKAEIKAYIEDEFNYDLSRTVEEIRPGYKFDISCQGSVPGAIICFLESEDYESCIRLSISIGGDSDTIACIAGGIAQAYYKFIAPELIDTAIIKLTDEMIGILEEFEKEFFN